MSANNHAGKTKTIEEIRTLIPAAKNLQSRIVTKEDLVSRLYLLPNQYGTIFRAGITENPNNTDYNAEGGGVIILEDQAGISNTTYTRTIIGHEANEVHSTLILDSDMKSANFLNS